jgi:hypothetical protein
MLGCDQLKVVINSRTKVHCTSSRAITCRGREGLEPAVHIVETH